MQFDDSSPIFLQLAAMLEDGIVSGAYPEETQVPSTPEIAVGYKINPATALKGMNLLVERGLLYKKRGLGMYVAAGAREKLLAERREGFRSRYIEPLLEEAEKLEINREELRNMIGE
ncbi:MAG: GntR family transcriptional regulator [Clostridiaceae bacterium]|nr:GntR family transcriptional regulator [Clostridiaceae bacterium]